MNISSYEYTEGFFDTEEEAKKAFEKSTYHKPWEGDCGVLEKWQAQYLSIKKRSVTPNNERARKSSFVFIKQFIIHILFLYNVLNIKMGGNKMNNSSVENNKTKELHVWMGDLLPNDSFVTYKQVTDAISRGETRIDTPIPNFCSSEYYEMGYRIFVHMIDGECVEIKTGHVETTSRDIKSVYNWMKLMLANEFGHATNSINYSKERRE